MLGKCLASDPHSDLQLRCDRLQAAGEALQAKILEQQNELESLRESERRYRALVELAPDAIVTLDWRGRIASANGVTCGIEGYTPEEVVGKPFWKLGLFRMQDIPKYLRLFVALLRGKSMAPIELVCLSKDGTEVVVECRASVMREGGKVLGLQLISRNVTELRKAEQALRESEQTFRATLESTADGILVVAEDGKVKHFNERFLRMWGFPPELIATRDNALLLPYAAAQLRDPKAFLDQANKCFSTMGQESCVLHFKDGRIFERFSCPLMCDGRKAGYVSSFRDVTAKRQAERLAAIGEMAAGLAHESRNAMQRMQACLEMLALEVHDRPEALDLLGRLQAAQDHLYRLHEEVREYAAPIVLHCEPFCLEHVVREAWRQLEASWTARTVRFTCSVEHPPLCLDRLALESVFRNIFENSLAACRDPAAINVRSGTTALRDRPAVELVVRDNGPGLDAEQQLRIFEPFYTTKTRGTGLGMAISRRLVEAHGGCISARAATAGRRGNRRHPPGALSHVQRPLANRHRRRRTRHARLLRAILPRLGHEIVAVASNGRELVQRCHAACPDLLILDIRMPEMDGLQALEEICRVRPLPAILVSAYSDPNLLRRAEENYVMAYLIKPVKHADLVPAIALAMRRFEQLEASKKEASDLRQSLEDRKLVERAKGMLVAGLRLDEAEAFRHLQKLAMQTNQKLVTSPAKSWPARRR